MVSLKLGVLSNYVIMTKSVGSAPRHRREGGRRVESKRDFEKGSLRAARAISYVRARTQSGGTRVAAWIAVRDRTTSKSAASAARLRGV